MIPLTVVFGNSFYVLCYMGQNYGGLKQVVTQVFKDPTLFSEMILTMEAGVPAATACEGKKNLLFR